VAGTTTNRELFFHPFGIDHARQALTTFAEWLLIPERASGFLKLLPFLIILITIVLLISGRLPLNKGDNQSKGSWNNLPVVVKLLALYLFIYGIFLVFSISFLDANTPLDGRILSPVFVCGLITLLYFVDRLLKLIDLRIVKWSFIVAGFLFVTASIQHTSFIARESYKDGLGFNNLVWQKSETLAVVKGLPSDVYIYSNAPEPIKLFANRPALALPKKFDSANQVVNADYAIEFTDMMTNIIHEQSVLVYFSNVKRANLPDEAEILNEIPLIALYRTNDGTVYKTTLGQ
jgi:hypothetical protein